MEERLEGVQVQYNTDDITVVEVTTNFKKYIVRLPYKIIESQKGDRYGYSIGVKDWCKIKNINYKGYFYMVHEDCN